MLACHNYVGSQGSSLLQENLMWRFYFLHKEMGSLNTQLIFKFIVYTMPTMKQNADSGISIEDRKIWNDPVEEAIIFNHSFGLVFLPVKTISNFFF